MALDIRFNGIKPEQKCYRYSIQNNAENDKVFFILQSEISNIVSLKDLSKYDVYLKCESAGKEYLDKIKVDCFYVSETNAISIPFVLPLKTTQYRNIGFQIQFQDANSNLIAQTEIVGMELCGTIKADEEIPSKYPSELIRIENELTQQGEELANHEQRITDLEEHIPYTEKEIVVSDDVDSFENENGVDKLIRELESDGSVEKTFLIDKIYHEETKIEANPTLEEDNVYLDSQDFKDDFGEENLKGVFGNNFIIEDFSDFASKYNDILGEKTLSIEGGTQGWFAFNNCQKSKPITIIFGKLYHFNEHGEKIIDTNPSVVSISCKEYQGQDVNITEEYQEITIHADDNGYIEISNHNVASDGFIIYGFYTGTPAYTEYKKREIGKGGGGGSAVSNVEIKRVYLTYTDRKSIRSDYLGRKDNNNKPFINDSTRIFYNFETTPISSQIENEIANNRFVIRLDYPTSSNRMKINLSTNILKHQPLNRVNIGARSFAYAFKKVGSHKRTMLIDSLIFITPNDIKTNRYGEKYIHKRISLFDYISKVCYCNQGTLFPITNEFLLGQSVDEFFDVYLRNKFSIGIPHIQETGNELENQPHLFNGTARKKLYVNHNGWLGQTNGQTRFNSIKLNPAFTCYTPLKLNVSSYNDLELVSPYYIGKKTQKFELNDIGDYFITAKKNAVFMGRAKTRLCYMSARPRCAILSDNYETNDHSFLKTMPQSDQQIRLYCKVMYDISGWGIDLMPVFRTFITQK